MPICARHKEDNFDYGDYTDFPGDCVECELEELEELRKKLAASEAFERSVNEALNTGDGVYRP